LKVSGNKNKFKNDRRIQKKDPSEKYGKQWLRNNASGRFINKDGFPNVKEEE
jgi:hypothetical protein